MNGINNKSLGDRNEILSSDLPSSKRTVKYIFRLNRNEDVRFTEIVRQSPYKTKSSFVRERIFSPTTEQLLANLSKKVDLILNSINNNSKKSYFSKTKGGGDDY